MISDAELCAGVRRLRGAPQLDVRVRARAPLAGAEVGSGARFERVRARDRRSARTAAVLKVTAPDPVCVGARAALLRGAARRRCPARVPAVFGTGRGRGAGRTAGCCSRSSRRPRRWRPASALRRAARDRARIAATLGPRPGLAAAPVRARPRGAARARPEGLARLEALQAREPLVRDLATPACARARPRAAARADALRRAFAASPECVVHRDLHSGNVWLPRAGPPILFDWEAVCAGPPIFDATLLESVSRDPPAPHPAARGRGGLLRRRRRRAGRSSSAPASTRSTRRATAPAPRAAIASAANAAFAWEALYRLGWCAVAARASRLPRARAPPRGACRSSARCWPARRPPGAATPRGARCSPTSRRAAEELLR